MRLRLRGAVTHVLAQLFDQGRLEIAQKQGISRHAACDAHFQRRQRRKFFDVSNLAYPGRQRGFPHNGNGVSCAHYGLKACQRIGSVSDPVLATNASEGVERPAAIVGILGWKKGERKGVFIVHVSSRRPTRRSR